MNYYVRVPTVSGSGTTEVLINSGALSGAAPVDAVLGVDILNGDFYTSDGLGGNWVLMPFTPSNILQNSGSGVFTGSAGSYILGLDTSNKDVYIADNAGNWAAIADVAYTTVDPTGETHFNKPKFKFTANGKIYGRTAAGIFDEIPYTPGSGRTISDFSQGAAFPSGQVADRIFIKTSGAATGVYYDDGASWIQVAA